MCCCLYFFMTCWNSFCCEKGKKIQFGAWFLFPVLILEINKNANETAKKMKKIPTKI